jgi:N-acetylglucosaminyldiphosphoundecaprenol N-acetyl-beta-D-mannosaminyltransferase
LLGLPFDAVDTAGAVRRVLDAAARRSGCFMSTPNVNWLIGCRTDPRFRDSVIHSDLSVADGMPLVWIARILGIPLKDRVAGSTVFEALRQNTQDRVAVFFFGGPDGVAQAACRRLAQDGGGLTCAGYESPGFGSIEDMSSDGIVQRINASGADFLLVSLGALKGQAWIERNRRRLNVPVICHLGTVLHFVAGTVDRAPTYMQQAGLEWLWRIKEDPALWQRYFSDGLALIRLVITRVLPLVWFRLRNNPALAQRAGAGAEIEDDERNLVVRLHGAWTQNKLGPLRDSFSRAAMSGKDVTLEMGRVTYVDSAFVGLVMLLRGHQEQRGKRLLMVSLQSPVRRVLKYYCAEFLYSGAV